MEARSHDRDQPKPNCPCCLRYQPGHMVAQKKGGISKKSYGRDGVHEMYLGSVNECLTVIRGQLGNSLEAFAT